MSLSDCIKCWNTPCTCGWEYKEYSINRLQEQIKMLQKVVDFKIKNPDYEFDILSEKFEKFMYN